MIDQNTKVGIVGLGLLGGSYAKGFFNEGISVTGIDIDENAIQYALEQKWITNGGTDASLLKDCDIVISALYPKTFIAWIKENQQYLKSGSFLSDVTGVKCRVIEEVNAVLRKDVEFIACHPMAGREYKGITYADEERFKNANFIIVATEKNTPEAIRIAEEIADTLHFAHVGYLSPEKHDRMIGFLSQLTHVIAVSLMNMSDNSELAEFTGDSFRDLTRIARINEELWPELFVMNKEYLTRQIDLFTEEMEAFRRLIEAEDIDAMKEKLRISTERRKAFSRKKEKETS